MFSPRRILPPSNGVSVKNVVKVNAGIMLVTAAPYFLVQVSGQSVRARESVCVCVCVCVCACACTCACACACVSCACRVRVVCVSCACRVRVVFVLVVEAPCSLVQGLEGLCASKECLCCARVGSERGVVRPCDGQGTAWSSAALCVCVVRVCGWVSKSF